MTEKKTKKKNPKKKNEIPRWIHQKENCLCCNRSSSLDYVNLPENGDSIIMYYKCQNEECIYPLSGNYKFGFRVTGEYYIKQYKQFVESTKSKIDLEL